MSSISGAGSSPIQTHVIPVAKRRVIELIAELEELEKGDATTNATAIKGVIAELRDSYHIDVDKGTILIGSRKTPHQVEVRASGDSWRPVKTLDSLTERAKVLWLHAPMMQEAAKQSSKAATGHIEAEGTFEWSAKGKLSKGEIALDQAPLPGRLKKFTQYFMGYQPYEKLVKVATGKSVARPFAHVVHEVADLAQEVFQQDRVPNYPLQIAYRIGELVVNEVKNSLGDTASPLIQKLRDSITDPAFQGRFETALKKCQTAMTQGQSHDNALARLYVEVGSLCGPVIQAIMDDESWQKNKTVFGMSRPDVAERGEALESILKQMTTDLQAALAAGSAVPAAATPSVAATPPPLVPLAATPEGLSTWEQACKDATAWMQALQADSSRNTGNRARILLAQWRQWPSPDVFLGELFSQKALQEMIGLDEGEYDKDALEAYLQQQIEEPAPPPAAPVEVVPPHVEPRTLLTAYLSPWLTEVGPVVRDMEAKKPLQVFLKNAVGSAEGQEALVNELLKQRTIQDALANPRVTTALSIALNKLFVLTDEQAEAIIGKWILVPFPSFWGHRDTPVYKMIAEAVAIDRAAPNGTRQWDKKIKDIWAEAKRHLPLKEGVNVHALAQYLRDIDPLPAGDISGVF